MILLNIKLLEKFNLILYKFNNVKTNALVQLKITHKEQIIF